MLDFELLRTFVAVADCGGFHRAAELLNLTQSTVSQQIKRPNGPCSGGQRAVLH
jgi:DNA-binding transcriptional LysR family regulator